MRKVCMFTGTRAEYGLLTPLVAAIAADPEFSLTILVSGTHLSPEFGRTADQIHGDFAIETVETLLSSDSPVGSAKSFGLGAIGYADALARIGPEICVVAGDRYEALSFACTCAMLSLPIAHLHGGETSAGSLDEHYRHAITKLSELHFASTDEYRRRIIQMGESPERVFNVGAIGLDNLRSMEFLPRDVLEVQLGIKFSRRNYLVTYHPDASRDPAEQARKAKAFVYGLRTLRDCTIFATRANADANGRLVNAILEDFEASAVVPFKLFASLGSQRYFSLMAQVDAVVGNSSSGLIEAPSFGVPTVNVGSRQDGRIRAASVIDCAEDELPAAIAAATSEGFRARARATDNPYGDGKTAERILAELRRWKGPSGVKKFCDIGGNFETDRG